jgi:hypothetical protein
LKRSIPSGELKTFDSFSQRGESENLKAAPAVVLVVWRVAKWFNRAYVR